MSEHLVFWVVLGACVCGALIAVGLAEYAVWLASQTKSEQEEGRPR